MNTESSQQPAGISLIIVHVLAGLSLFWAELKWEYIGLCIASYYLRMFGITGGFHRYFSHKTYKTSRLFQFALGFLGTTALQRGPLWWAAVHRHHHIHSDQPSDLHSPVVHGFYQSHIGWVLNRSYKAIDMNMVKDLSKFPELKWLDKYYLIPPMLYAIAMTLAFGINGLIWGALVSNVFLWHGTFTINSLTHVFGKQRFKTGDQSRNSFILALVTLGEGWHNNHHFYPGVVRQGFFPWEIDISYYIIRILGALGIVWNIKEPNYDHIRVSRIDVGTSLPSIGQEETAATSKPRYHML